jgi:phage tail sheath protein FI
MTNFTYPGVYNQEVASGPGPITGVSTANLGLIGYSPKGPINDPTLCTSFPEYVSKFGTFNSDSISAHEAYAYFENGGRILYFVRVTAPDAIASYYNLVAPITAEQVSNVAQPSGVYNLQLDKAPVSPSSLVLTFDNTTPANVNVFTCNSTGTLTFSTALSGASAGGGSGTVDLSTGEVHVELNTPGQFAGSTKYVLATYNYIVFGFEMAWPGVAGNYYRVVIEPGSDDYLVQAQARWTNFNVSVEEDINAGVGVASWNRVKTWPDLVFDDVTSPQYIATVINADETSILTIVDYGNGIDPPTLQGSSVTDEDIDATQKPVGSTSVVAVPYDSTTKAWTYELAAPAFPQTLVLEFQFADALVMHKGLPTTEDPAGLVLTDAGASFGATNALLGKVAANLTAKSSGNISASTGTTATATLQGVRTTWLTTDAYAILDPKVKIGIGTGATGDGTEAIVSPGTTLLPAAIMEGSVCISVTMSGAGAQVCLDDGAGNINGNFGGAVATIGTINYVTGQITSAGAVADQLDFDAAWIGETVVAGTNILFGCVYKQPIALSADADGIITKDATQATGYPQKFNLNTSGTNAIDNDTGEIELTWKITGNPSAGPSGSYLQTVSYYTNPATSVTSAFSGGTDGSAITSTDVVDPSLSASKEGLYAFGKEDAMMNLVVADFQTDIIVSSALITYCELMKDKFAIISVPHGYTYEEAMNWKKYTLNTYTSFAALYYPHVKILDPVSKVNIDIPGGAHIAGVYARTDASKNVGKAPAGMGDGDLRWVVGLESQMDRDQVGLVYEQKINPLVDWTQTGRVVWGARTLEAAGGEYASIQGRRTMMFVQKSVYNATHVHVFKNNGPGLWNAITAQLTSFLGGLHTAGYFAGTTPSESFFVVCDGTINTQDVIDSGICYTDVGIATNKPAEFLVFRYSQKATA